MTSAMFVFREIFCYELEFITCVSISLPVDDGFVLSVKTLTELSGIGSYINRL